MRHIGVDLHRETVVTDAVNDAEESVRRSGYRAAEDAEIVAAFKQLGPFRAVIEATLPLSAVPSVFAPGHDPAAPPVACRPWSNVAVSQIDWMPITGAAPANQPDPVAYIPADNSNSCGTSLMACS